MSGDESMAGPLMTPDTALQMLVEDYKARRASTPVHKVTEWKSFDFQDNFMNDFSKVNPLNYSEKPKKRIAKAVVNLITGGDDTKKKEITKIFSEDPKRIRKFQLAQQQLKDSYTKKKQQKKIILNDYYNNKDTLENQLRNLKQITKFEPIMHAQKTLEKELDVVNAMVNESIKALSMIQMLQSRQVTKLNVGERELLGKRQYYETIYNKFMNKKDKIERKIKKLEKEIVKKYKEREYPTKYDNVLRKMYDDDDMFGTPATQILSDATITGAPEGTPAKNFFRDYEEKKNPLKAPEEPKTH